MSMCEMLDDSSRFLWIAIDEFVDGHRVTLGGSLDGWVTGWVGSGGWGGVNPGQSGDIFSGFKEKLEDSLRC